MTADEDPNGAPDDPSYVGHFRILGRLGQGGMGVVFRAEDTKLRRIVALKVLRDPSDSEERRQRFLREARSAAAITHANVAHVYEVGERAGRVHIAMELVEGESLRARLERGRLDAVTTRALGVQIARGLAAAHRKGIVHRDLKPENVMVTPAGDVKLLDFGLAKAGAAEQGAPMGAEEALARTETVVTSGEGRIIGTPEYMSPEQALGEPLLVGSDVFSLGVVLYEMLAGARPFDGPTTRALLVAIARDPAPPLGDPLIDDELRAVVMRCLAKAPRERFASGAEVALALSSPTPTPTTTPPPGPRAGATSGGRARTAWRAALALAALAAIAAGAWSTRSRVRAAGPSVAAAGAPVGGQDLPARSRDPDAQRLFDEGMRSFHDGTGQAVPLLEKAVAADPSFGGAYLRLWLMAGTATGAYSPYAPRRAGEYHERVLALQTTLSEGDKALLACMDAASPAEGNAKLDAYLARFPGEDVAWVLRLDETLATTLRILAARPTLVPVMAYEAQDFRVVHRFDEAAAVVERCLALSPRSTDCLLQRAYLRDAIGECAGAEADVRRQLELAPEARVGLRRRLAGLLAAQGASIDAVTEAFRADAPLPDRDVTRPLPVTVLPMFEGDFAEVERLAREALEQVSPAAADLDHARPARTLVEAYTEAGDLAAAGRVAADYLSRRAAWSGRQPDYAAPMIRATARAGLATPAEANRFLAEALGAPTEPPAYPAWLGVYAATTETRDEALAAVALLDTIPVRSPGAEWRRLDGEGRTLFLAGRGRDARPLLAATARECSTTLLNARAWLRAQLYLGELDEDSGERSSACDHYAQVIRRWGGARPRSVTADEARAHASALGCPR